MAARSDTTLANPPITDRQAFEALGGSNISMVLTDPYAPDHPIVYVNRAFETTTGYAASSAIGRNCRFLQGEDTDADDVRRIRQAIENVHDISVDVKNYRADGTPFINRLLISPVMTTDGELRYFLGIQKPVDAREDALSPNALNHAMREVQHRVKNHLAMVVSLIRMHGREAGDAQKQFDILTRRVESLQVLYQEMSAPATERNMDVISLSAYLSRLASATQALDGRPGVRMNLSLDDVQVQTDSAVSIGLVVSEVLNNALKHAFAGRDRGLIELRVTRLSGGAVRIMVSDDGVGMDKDAEWPNADSVGGRVIQGLITQLDGTVEVMRGANGTVVSLEVPGIAGHI